MSEGDRQRLFEILDTMKINLVGACRPPDKEEWSLIKLVTFQKTQRNHADIVGYLTPFNQAFKAKAAARLGPTTAIGEQSLDNIITLQSTIIACVDDFKLLMIMSPSVIPLLLVLRKPAKPPEVDPSVAME